MTVLTGAQIPAFRLLALRQALKLEIQGMKVLKGRTAYSIIKNEFGWSGNRQTILNKMNQVRNLILTGDINESDNVTEPTNVD